MNEIQKQIKKTEKELNWIKKTIESLKKREQNKLQLLMNLKIQELKKNLKTDEQSEPRNKCIMNLEIDKNKKLDIK